MADIAEARIDSGIPMEGDFSPRKIKVAAGVLIGQSFATSILPYSAIMLMLIPFTTEFHWTAAQFSWSITCLFMAGAVSLWPIGRIADKVGVRPVLIIGTLVVGLVTLGMAFQTEALWQFYVYYALLGVFGSTGVTYSKVVAALFTQHRGKAMAFLNAETTVARALVPLATNWLLLSYGWRTMYLVFGITILAMVPVLFFTIEEPGQRGLSFRRAANAPSPPPRMTFEGMTIWEALKDWSFWLMLVAVFIGLFIFNGMFPHMVPAMIGKGFDQTTVVELTSGSILVGVLGSLAGGWVADRFPTAKVAVPFCLLSALGTLILLFVSSSWGGVPLLAVSVGLGMFSFNAMFPLGMYFPTRFFGLASYTEIVAVMFAITNIFAGFSAPLFGAIYDSMHSYDAVFITTTALWLLAAVIWFLMPKYRYAKNIGQMPAAATATAAAEGEVL